MPRKISERAILFASLFAAVFAFSLIFFPSTIPQTLVLTSGSPKKILIDTGYGFDDIQAREVPANGVVEFSRWRYPDRVGFDQAVAGRVTAGDKTYDLNFEQKDEGGRNLFVAKMSKAYGPRNSFASFWFLVGLIFSTLPFFILAVHLLSVFRRSWADGQKRLFFFTELLLLGAWGVALYFLYPGFLNPFDPTSVFDSYELYRFTSAEFFSGMWWGILYEAIPSIYFTYCAQSLYFLGLLLILRDRIFWAKSPAWQLASYAAIVLILFYPTSVIYSLFLDRNILNGMAVFLTFVTTWSFFSQRNSKTQWWEVSLALVICSLIRNDNLYFALAILVAGFKFKDRKLIQKQLGILIASYLFFYGPFAYYILGSSQFANREYVYLHISATFADTIQSVGPENISRAEREDLNEILHMEKIEKEWKPYESANIQSISRTIDGPTPDGAGSTVLNFTKKHFYLLLKSRVVRSWDLLTRYSNVYDYKDGLWFRKLLMDARVLPHDHSGARAIFGKLDKYISVKTVPSYLFFFIMIAAMFFWRSAPVTALCCIAFIPRLALLFLFAGPNHMFIYDICLIGFVLPLLFFTERRHSVIS